MDSANFNNKAQIHFPGAPNFRDLGGYQTIDGRFVRKGLLYRSCRLSELSDTDLYKQLFEILLDPGNLPLVFAGKARTGRAAMVILLALGVPEETIYKDYLLSNDRMALVNQKILKDMLKSSDKRLHPENVRSMLILQREYLAASFIAMKDEYGSSAHYLNEILPNHDLDRLREIFLT